MSRFFIYEPFSFVSLSLFSLAHNIYGYNVEETYYEKMGLTTISFGDGESKEKPKIAKHIIYHMTNNELEKQVEEGIDLDSFMKSQKCLFEPVGGYQIWFEMYHQFPMDTRTLPYRNRHTRGPICIAGNSLASQNFISSVRNEPNADKTELRKTLENCDFIFSNN